jgi:hypothetical protein
MVAMSKAPKHDRLTAAIEAHLATREATEAEATAEEVDHIYAQFCKDSDLSEKEKAVLPMAIRTLLNIRLKELRIHKD